MNIEESHIYRSSLLAIKSAKEKKNEAVRLLSNLDAEFSEDEVSLCEAARKVLEDEVAFYENEMQRLNIIIQKKDNVTGF